jgi:beta-phosphoglucomutase
LSGGNGHAWDALLFDFDGVLADTERVHHACWNQVLEPFRIQFSWPDYQKQCIGVADLMVAERLGLADPAGVAARKQALFREAVERTPPFLDETLELVRELSGLHRLAVVSSSYRSEVEPPLVRAAIRQCFETVITGDQVRRLKPAPDPYLLAAQTMRLSRPLVIEDSDTGVASGRAAGFEVLRVSSVQEVAREVRAYLNGG